MLRFSFLISVGTLLALGFTSGVSLAQNSSDVRSKKGLTFTSRMGADQDIAGVFTAFCDQDSNAMNRCNPIHGDTLCNVSRPLLCILDIDAPAPEVLDNPHYWTGGVLALSSPVSAEKFSHLSDANAYCEATFGEYWRVASFHDGGAGALKGYGVSQKWATRFWVDIKNQPKATCWSR